ncbi:tRNA-His guanylyltransferase [Paramarasmius palmivorus]|uniref:tRNA(His) guanylyltransferase n=1 Tax=Paramarasmius palmivorus TaxID=297713 RepID=A0AAW0CFC9_9AGAR
MSGSKFEYVKKYELPDPLLLGTYMVFRLDGHSFHRFSDEHGFTKPNDVRALQLMDRAAEALMNEYRDIVLGFGESDEYRFQINYNDVDARFRKGSVVIRVEVPSPDEPPVVATILSNDVPLQEERKTKAEKKQKSRKTKIEIIHCDIIRDDFWNQHVEILDQ